VSVALASSTAKPTIATKATAIASHRAATTSQASLGGFGFGFGFGSGAGFGFGTGFVAGIGFVAVPCVPRRNVIRDTEPPS
jgi:hypothetical protein